MERGARIKIRTHLKKHSREKKSIFVNEMSTRKTRITEQFSCTKRCLTIQIVYPARLRAMSFCQLFQLLKLSHIFHLRENKKKYTKHRTSYNLKMRK